MIEETNEELQVQLDDHEEATESVEIPEETQEASTDSGGDDELDKYTRGVSKRINKLNERIRLACRFGASLAANTRIFMFQAPKWPHFSQRAESVIAPHR